MVFIDVHCHLDMLENINEIIRDAREKNVSAILTAGTNIETNRNVLFLSKEFREVKASLGIYPIEALKYSEVEIEKEIDFIRKNNERIIAIGEVGMDFKESSEKEKQERLFLRFISLALELNRPLIVHSRKAEKECIELLEKENVRKIVMHCFSGRKHYVQKIIQNKWFISVPAIVTYSEHFQNIVKLVPLDQLLCETDSPFLHPKKIFPNTPSQVIESYKKIAEIKNKNLKEVENKIEKNFTKLFNEDK